MNITIVDAFKGIVGERAVYVHVFKGIYFCDRWTNFLYNKEKNVQYYSYNIIIDTRMCEQSYG